MCFPQVLLGDTLDSSTSADAHAAVAVAVRNDRSAQPDSTAAEPLHGLERPPNLGSYLTRKISGIFNADGVGARRGLGLEPLSAVSESEGASTPNGLNGSATPTSVFKISRQKVLAQRTATQSRGGRSKILPEAILSGGGTVKAAATLPLTPHGKTAGARVKRARANKGKRIYGVANRAVRKKARESKNKVLGALLHINVSFLPKHPLKRLYLLNRRIRWLQVR